MEISEYSKIRQRRYLKWGIICALIGHFVFHIWDRIYYPGLANLLLLITCVEIVVLTVLLIFVDKISTKHLNLYTYLVIDSICWNLSVQCYFVEGYNNPIYLNHIVLILISALLTETPIRHYIGILILIVVFHFTIVSFHQPFHFDAFATQLFYINASAIAAAILNHNLHKIRKREEKASQEKEYLLKEIHHRVKNNLQIIISLLDLQARRILDDTAKLAVTESKSRIHSMALIHSLMYQKEVYMAINFSEYLSLLLSSLHSVYQNPEKDISYSISAEKTNVDIDHAIPLGLITNEIVTNSFKYAFTDTKTGKIWVDFKETKPKNYRLVINDNGKGLPKGFKIEDSNTLGLKLVGLLSRQINAQISFSYQNGAKFELILKV